MIADKCECQCGRWGCASQPGKRVKRSGVTVHGLPSGYSNGCRCDACTSAHTAKAVRQRNRANSKSRERAVKNGQPWTGPELETVVREDLTAAEAAALLGRTLKAVKNMRAKCRTDPKFIQLLGAARESLSMKTAPPTDSCGVDEGR